MNALPAPYESAYQVWLKDCYTQEMTEYVEKNPYKIYGDYRDEISDEQAAMILEGKIDSFWESIWEWEISASDHADWSYWESEFAEEFDFESWDDVPEEIQEFVYQERIVDCSDMVDSAIRNKRVHVAAIPKNENGDYFDVPHYDLEPADNARLFVDLRNTFGILEPWSIEPTYSSEVLKVCGTLDLAEIIKNDRLPTHITLTPAWSDQVLFHTSGCGAGNCGSVKLTRTVTVPCDFRNDETDRYGIDAVYGFVGSVWAEEFDTSSPQEA